MLVFLIDWGAGKEGARDMPIVYARCQEIGRQIKLRAPPPVPLLAQPDVCVRFADGRYLQISLFDPSRYDFFLTQNPMLATHFAPMAFNDVGFDGIRLTPISNPSLPHPTWRKNRVANGDAPRYETTASQLEANFLMTVAGLPVASSTLMSDTVYNIISIPISGAHAPMWSTPSVSYVLQSATNPGGATPNMQFVLL